MLVQGAGASKWLSDWSASLGLPPWYLRNLTIVGLVWRLVWVTSCDWVTGWRRPGYARGILKQSCVICHITLTEENKEDLERVQKTPAGIFYKKYMLIMEIHFKFQKLTLFFEERKKPLYKFRKSCEKMEHTRDLFPLNLKAQNMNARGAEK